LRIAYAAAACAAVVAIVTPVLASAILPLSSDQGLYITVGEILKRGGVVGRDAWDTKPPGVYYLYAGLLALAPDYSTSCTLRFALLPSAEHQVPCARLVLAAFDAVYTLALAGAVGWLGRGLFGPAAGALAALLCAIYGSMLQLTNGGGIADLYVLLPSTLAYAAAFQYARTSSPRWLVVAGALGASAALFKQTGLIFMLGLGIWLLVRGFMRTGPGRSATWKACVALTAGAAGVLAATAIPLAMAGAFWEVLDQAFLFNLYYVGRPANVNDLPMQFLTQTWAVFTGSQSGLWLAGLGGLVMLVRPPMDSRAPLLLAWITASAATILAGGSQLHVNYYLALVPCLSILGGYVLVRLWRGHGLLQRASLVVASSGLLAFSSQLQDHQYGNAWYSRLVSNTHSTEEFVAGAIGSGSGSLFVWGNGPQVYALSGRLPASRYLHTLALSYDYAVHDELQRNRAELMATLQGTPPQVIAIDRPWLRRAMTLDFPELNALIAQDYELANAPANPIFRGWQIYRRRTAE